MPGALYGSKFAACFNSSLVMESLSLSGSFFDLSPGTIWKALGASATSFAPMPEEAADAHDIGFDLAVLVEQDVADVADLLVVGAEDVGRP